MNTLTLSRLLAAEELGWDSLCRSDGAVFYGELMTPDAVMVLVNGMVLDRDTVAGSLNDAPPWSAYEITNPRVVPIGDDAADLVYRASATRDGAAEPFTALMTSVYCQIGDDLRLALYQQTALPG